MSRRNRKAVYYPIPKECRYCGGEVIYVSNKEIYGKEYGADRGSNMCYLCVSCKASIGVHPYTDIPLGIMADDNLKTLKKEAHALFDPIWKNGQMTRTEAYRWLAKKLGIPERECHIGWFDEEMLMRVINGMKRLYSKQKKSE